MQKEHLRWITAKDEHFRKSWPSPPMGKSSKSRKRNTWAELREFENSPDLEAICSLQAQSLEGSQNSITPRRAIKAYSRVVYLLRHFTGYPCQADLPVYNVCSLTNRLINVSPLPGLTKSGISLKYTWFGYYSKAGTFHDNFWHISVGFSFPETCE